jgi:hypothetical protein
MHSGESLPATFERLVNEIISAEPDLVYRWDAVADTRRRLVFPKQCENGFEVIAEAEPYGLYAFAEGWHSAAWDANTPGFRSEQVTASFVSFLRTLLSADARLEVHYAAPSPTKWVMRYVGEHGEQADTISAVHNLFSTHRGASSVVTLRNSVLTSRLR